MKEAVELQNITETQKQQGVDFKQQKKVISYTSSAASFRICLTEFSTIIEPPFLVDSSWCHNDLPTTSSSDSKQTANDILCPMRIFHSEDHVQKNN